MYSENEISLREGTCTGATGAEQSTKIHQNFMRVLRGELISFSE